MSVSRVGSDSTSSSAPLRTIEGRYQLQEMIGRGGMATVYRAVDTVLDRPVAVKLLYPSVCSETEFVEQFLKMERHIARLFHPRLVTIYDAGASDEGCFAVMEYVPGGSLRDLLERGQRFSVPDAVRLGAQIADALQLLHQERIIHGDVKPDNVLLDQEGDAKLVDFGIAHLATTTASINSQALGGSVPYLAPEQLEHGRADARSDIYALGLVVYELLAGHKAFDGENWVAVAAQRLARDPAPLSRTRPDLPPGLEAVIMRSLARNPAERFASAREMQQALLDVLARPESSPDGEMAPIVGAVPGEPSVHLQETQRVPLPSRPAPRPVQPSRSTEQPPRLSASRPAEPRTPRPESTLARPRTTPARGSTLARIMRAEHPLAVPLAATVVALDVLLLLAILALAGGRA